MALPKNELGNMLQMVLLQIGAKDLTVGSGRGTEGNGRGAGGELEGSGRGAEGDPANFSLSTVG